MKNKLLTISLLFAMALIFALPAYHKITNIGVSDWDLNLFHHEAVRKTVVEYRQIPLWNPWHCGGHVSLANPHVRFPTPYFPLHLIFGTNVALKLEIFLHLFLGLLGLWFVARNIYGISRFSLAVLPAFYFCFSSFFTLQIAEGHVWILTIFYFPFIFYFYEKYVRDRWIWNLIAASAFFSLMIYEGGLYPVPNFVLFLSVYSLLSFFVKRNPSYIWSLLLLFVLAGLFSAFKLIPMIDFLSNTSRYTSANEYIPLQVLYDIFISRNQILDYGFRFKGQLWGWHEYGCYLGWGLVTLLFASFWFVLRYKNTRKTGLILLATITVFSVFFIGNVGSFSPYALLSHLPFFNQMRVTGRFLMILTFSFSLITMLMMSQIESMLDNIQVKKRMSLIAIANTLLVLIFIDMAIVSWKPFTNAFPIPAKNAQALSQSIKDKHFSHLGRLPLYGKWLNSAQYPAILANKGTLGCYEPLKIPRGSLVNDNMLKGIQGLIETKLIKFTPNRITFDAEVNSKSSIILFNMNYLKGWKTNIKGAELLNVNNRIALRIPKGKYEKAYIYYRPESFIIGSAVTGIFLLLLIGFKKFS